MKQLSKTDWKSLLDKNKLKEQIRLIFNIKVVKTAALIFFGLVLIVLSYSSAKLFWSFFPEYVNKKINTSAPTANVRVERNYLDEIFNSKIFPASSEKLKEFNRRIAQNGKGPNTAGPKPVSNSAPVPQQVRPNIKITGILASDKPDNSVVILVFNNEENVYSEGEQLSGSAIRVSKIFEDRIEVLSADRKETYTYYMELSDTDRIKLLKENRQRGNNVAVNNQPAGNHNNNASRPVNTVPSNNTVNTVAHNTVSQPPRDNASADKNNESAKSGSTGGYPLEVIGPVENRQPVAGTSIQDYVNISPVENEQGTGVKGYRLNPGRKPELFTKSGFVPNDLAIRVNGYDLTDPTQTRQLFSEFSTMKNFEITVERDGIPENIYINLGEGSLPNTMNTGVR